MSTELECLATVCEAALSCAHCEPGQKLFEQKLSAMKTLLITCRRYLNEGFMPELITAICTKKANYIAAASTKKELDEILKASPVRYNGCEVVSASEYSVPEEELIIWSLTSLQAPLNSYGQARYMKLFRQILPDTAVSIFGEKEGIEL